MSPWRILYFLPYITSFSVDKPLPRVYDIYESTAFTPEQSAALHAAETSWMVALPGELLLRASLGPCPKNDPRAAKSALACIAPATADEMFAETANRNVVGVSIRENDTMPWHVLLDSEWASGAMGQGVFAHELGHVMGLQHTTKTHTLMYPNTQTCNDSGKTCTQLQSVTPTATDIAAWRYLRVHT